MRRIRTLAVAVLLLTAASCDSTQPAQTGSQNFAVSFGMGNSVVALWDVWDMFQDQNADGIPDDTNGDGVPDQIATYCEEARDNQGNRRLRAATSVPWFFTVEVELIRAGQTTSQRLTTAAAAASQNANLTPYDDLVELNVTPACPSNQNCPGQFIFLNPRRISSANRFVFEQPGINEPPKVPACPNAPAIGDPGFADPSGTGVPPRVAQPIALLLEKGDTVVVRARKSDKPLGLDVRTEPSLDSIAALDGQTVIAEGTGNVVSGALSYVFTLR